MSLSIRPVFCALRRKPAGAILVALEIAIALAVLVNSASIVSQRIARIERPTGLEPADTFSVFFAGFTRQFDPGSAIREDLAYLRSIPGVVSAVATTGIPLTNDGSGTNLYRQPAEGGAPFHVSELPLDEHGLQTLGVPLLAGRNFRPEEIQFLSKKNLGAGSPEIIVTRSLARSLFPHGGALGKAVYDSDGRPMTIIGITRDFIGPQLSNPLYDTVIYPQIPGAYGFYICLVRTQPGKAHAIMRAALRHLAASNPQRVAFYPHTLEYFKHERDAENRDMAIFLTFVTALVVAITGLGIFGLTTFNVSTRTKQIGTMRAVGARRRDVVAHFLMENAIILALGTLIGCTLALGVGYWLTTEFQVPRLNLAYLALGVIGLTSLGQLAAWHPARRAASVSPSVATRTI